MTRNEFCDALEKSGAERFDVWYGDDGGHVCHSLKGALSYTESLLKAHPAGEGITQDTPFVVSAMHVDAGTLSGKVEDIVTLDREGFLGLGSYF